MPAASAPLLYRERLSAPWTVWMVVMVLIGTLGIAYGAAAGVSAGIGTTLLAGGLAAALLLRSAAPVVVTTEELVAGRARIPLRGVGTAVALDAERTRWLRGPGIDPSAFMVMRGWIPTGVLIEVVDAHDPTPYWLLSSRHPDRLVTAIETARAGAG